MRYENRKRFNSRVRSTKKRGGRRLFLESLEARVVLAGADDVAEAVDPMPDHGELLAAEVAQEIVAEGEHTVESQAEHIHAHLTIFVDGTQVVIPNNIGVGNSGFLSQIHTHDDLGTLHIHPIASELRDRTNTLSDFFDTWRTNAGLAGNNPNAILSATQLLDNVTNTTDTLKMFVNGQLSAEFGNHVLHDDDDIVLVYGSDPVVSLNTNFGSIVVELFENDTPGTVNNFLNYVNDGDYVNSFFHRSATFSGAAVIQGGGFRTSSNTFTNTAQFTSVPTDPPIQNEPGISNVRGTIAMAKSSNPNSATSQFFVNLNAANTLLDDPNNSGGFTVFGHVLDLRSSDEIKALPINTSNSSPFGELPLSADNQLVVIESIVGQGEISGTHFNDVNRNGLLDPGESTISGATIYIDDNTNGVLDPGELSTATDANGRYLFQLDPASYTVRAEFDAALSLTVPSPSDSYTVTVEIGREVTDRDFGVAEINDTPLTQTDTYTVNEDAVLTVTAANGVLANDTSQTSVALSATVNTQPANGTLTLSSNGSFTYTPNANFFGTNTFTYIASDGTNQSSATTVTVTVNAQPDAPVAVADSLTISNSRTPRTINVLGNDTSAPDAVQTLTVTSVTQGTSGGTVTLTNGVVSYLAPEGFIGTDTFNYTIQDTDGLTSFAAATINVTEVANNSLSGFVYLDADGNGLRDTGEVGVPGAQITLSGSGLTRTILTTSSGAYTFTELPAGTYQLVERQPTAVLDGTDSTTVPNAVVGNDQITQIALDGGQDFAENNFGEMGIQSQYVSIVWFFASSGAPEVMFREAIAMGEELAGDMALADTIRAGGTEVPDGTNSAPNANGDAFTVAENGVLTVTAAAGVLSNDTDVDGDSLTAVVLSQPGNGTLSSSGDGSFTYTPASGFVGADTFTYQASDGTALSNTATVTITVSAVDSTPVAVADSYSVDQNATLGVSSSLGVLHNDTDGDGDTLTAQQVTAPANGTLSLNADGSFTYTPTANFTGTDTFTYTASDAALTSAAATVTITVNPVNLAPVTAVDSYTLQEDSSLTVNAADGVLINDGDPEGAPLTAALVEAPDHGTLSLNSDGSFTYTPVANFSATDAFTYAASDGERTSGATTVTLLVQGLEDIPVGVNDSYSVEPGGILNVAAANGVLVNDSDADADTLTAVLVSSPANGTLDLNANGSFSYQPNNAFSGTDTFTYQASDGFFVSNTVTVTITVTPTDLVRIRLAAAANDGTPIDTIGVGESFVVNAFVEDIRSAPQGVFAAYLDVNYNSNIASVNGAIVYATAFSNGRSGSTATPGVIDEVGAFTQQTLGGGEAFLFSVPFVATADGTLNLVIDAADVFPDHDTLLIGIDNAIPIALLDFVPDSIIVTSPPPSAEGEGSGLAEYAANADEVFAAEFDWLLP
ncbi:MAG: Ig-like domain-containing protein [Planctomycetota bacterium]|nr:Ig-like domain-containing protein [Planctomycetota bacterium]